MLTLQSWSCTWWRHQMETFSALLAICAGNSPVPGELPTQRPVTRSFDIYFDLPLNKKLSKQSWGWWLEKLSLLLWRHRNDTHRDTRIHVYMTNFANVCGVEGTDILTAPACHYFSEAAEYKKITQRARFVGPTWGPSGSCRPQVGPMLAPWTLLSGKPLTNHYWLAHHLILRFISWGELSSCLWRLEEWCLWHM